jgi:hypothetical protein
LDDRYAAGVKKIPMPNSGDEVTQYKLQNALMQDLTLNPLDSFGLALLRYATRIRHPHRNASSSSAHFYLFVWYGVLLKVVPLGSVPFIPSRHFCDQSIDNTY